MGGNKEVKGGKEGKWEHGVKRGFVNFATVVL